MNPSNTMPYSDQMYVDSIHLNQAAGMSPSLGKDCHSILCPHDPCIYSEPSLRISILPSLMLSAGPLNAFSLLSSFTIYYITERVLRFTVSRWFHSPSFRSALRSSRKDSVYWGLLLGAVISFASFPFCAIATYDTWFSAAKTHLFPHSPDSPLTFSAEVCVTSRAVLWVSELNRLDLYPAYIVHHMASIVMLLFALHHGAVHLLYLPFTTLVSEIPGDFIWILSAHRDLASTSPELKTHYVGGGLERIRKMVLVINMWVYTLARVPSIPLMMYCSVVTAQQASTTLLGDRWGQVLLAFTTVILSLYSLWVGRYIKKQLSSIHDEDNESGSSCDKVVCPNADKFPAAPTPRRPFIQYSLEHPIHIRFRNGFILTLYGPLMGLALSSICIIALLLSSETESLHLIATSLMLTITLAILLARIFSLIFEDTLAVFLRNPIQVFLRPGFWLYGGFVGCIFGLGLARFLGLVNDLTGLSSAVGVALPLYEAISRLGCHTYGCCYGQPISEKKHVLLKFFRPVVYNSRSAAAVRLSPTLQSVPLFPIQMISSFLFIIQFIVVWTISVHFRILDLTEGAALSLVLHALTRLWTESLRSDFRGGDVAINFSGKEFALSVTARIALTQLLCGVLLAVYGHLNCTSPNTLWNILGFQRILLDTWAQGCVLGVFSLSTVVYGLHRREIGHGLQ